MFKLEVEGKIKLAEKLMVTSNVDSNPSRAGILRFNMSDWNGNAYNFNADGEIFALGMRNEVGRMLFRGISNVNIGLAVDHDGVLWGVENGVDNLDRAPWGNVSITFST